MTRWTIRLALTAYVAYLAACLSGAASRWPRAARLVWTLGCLLFVVHVACAFHFYHSWSHAVARQHTAKRTEQLLGIAFGDGIYFSYLFLALWVADATAMWRNSPARRGCLADPIHSDSASRSARGSASGVPLQRRRLTTPAWRGAAHAFLLFIAINGAIVFESGPTRWFGIAACLALGGLAARGACNGQRTWSTPRPDLTQS